MKIDNIDVTKTLEKARAMWELILNSLKILMKLKRLSLIKKHCPRGTMEGAYIFCRIRSYISTCRKHEIPIPEAIKMLFRGQIPEFMSG